MKIIKLDNVLVIKGKDRGKTGQVVKVFPKTGRVLVKGLNMVKKHQKPSRKNPRTGIIFKEMPITTENLVIICPHCNKNTKVGFSENADKKVRICKKCQGSLKHEAGKSSKN